MNKEEAIKEFKNYFPDGVEAIVLTKEDYNRQLGQLQFENIILRDRIDKAIEYIENKQKEIEKQPDYSKYLCPSIVEAIKVNNLSNSGMILETVKSTTIKISNDLLDILKGDNYE